MASGRTNGAMGASFGNSKEKPLHMWR